MKGFLQREESPVTTIKARQYAYMLIFEAEYAYKNVYLPPTLSKIYPNIYTVEIKFYLPRQSRENRQNLKKYSDFYL